MEFTISDRKDLKAEQVLPLYEANRWSAADKPDVLLHALQNAHALVSVWHLDQLVGLGNAISDGYLMVYFSHLLVHPDYQKMGIGSMVMDEMEKRYHGFHMQMLTADSEAVGFYERKGFVKAGDTVPMWKYGGSEHG